MSESGIVRINPVPFVLAPGIGLTGFVFGGLAGAGCALLGWTVAVAVATTCVVLRRALRGSERP